MHFRNKKSASLSAALISLALGASLSPAAEAQTAPLGQYLVTFYLPGATSIGWQVVGTISPGDTGSIGPFADACAIVEGTPTTAGNVITRNVYVLDAGNGQSGAVVLDVYTKTDTLATGSRGNVYATTQFTLNQAVSLPLTSAGGVGCYMAGNATSVFAGTSANDQAAIVNKQSLAVTTVSSAATTVYNPVTAINSTDGGDVMVTFGSGSNAGWVRFDNNSNQAAVGQIFGFSTVANTFNGVTLPH